MGNSECVHTTEEKCFGYFVGCGSTCGSSTESVCFEKGPCCTYNTDTKEVDCSEQTIDSCINYSDFLNIETTFGGTGNNNSLIRVRGQFIYDNLKSLNPTNDTDKSLNFSQLSRVCNAFIKSGDNNMEGSRTNPFDQKIKNNYIKISLSINKFTF